MSPTFTPGEIRHNCGTIINPTHRKLCGQRYSIDDHGVDIYRWCPGQFIGPIPIVAGDLLETDVIAGSIVGGRQGTWTPYDPTTGITDLGFSPANINNAIELILSMAEDGRYATSYGHYESVGGTFTPTYVPTVAEVNTVVPTEEPGTTFVIPGSTLYYSDAGHVLFTWQAIYTQFPEGHRQLHLFSAAAQDFWYSYEVVSDWAGLGAGTQFSSGAGMSDNGHVLINANDIYGNIGIFVDNFTHFNSSHAFLHGVGINNDSFVTGYTLVPLGGRSVVFTWDPVRGFRYPLEAVFSTKAQVCGKPNNSGQYCVAIGDGFHSGEVRDNVSLYRAEADDSLTPVMEEFWPITACTPGPTNDVGHMAAFIDTGTYLILPD